eukprot:1161002-Pelagomonas_calceolata.AAC.1
METNLGQTELGLLSDRVHNLDDVHPMHAKQQSRNEALSFHCGQCTGSLFIVGMHRHAVSNSVIHADIVQCNQF